MALAWIQLTGKAGPDWLLRCDIGTNRYFEFAVGGNTRMEYHGLEWLEDEVYRSEIQENKNSGPAPGRFELRIPAGRVRPGADFLQLYSYKTADRRGQAASEIIRLSAEASERSDLEVPALSRSTALPPRPAAGTINVSGRVLRKRPRATALTNFRWPGRATQQSRNGYVFDRPGDTAAGTLLLNDPVRHRDFWHKVWAGKASPHSSECRFETRYIYAVDGKAMQNGRLETVAERQEYWSDEEREVYDLESGLLLAYSGLNRLLTALDKPPLPEAALSALAEADFGRFLGSEATATLGFDGLEGGEMLAIWAFPEVSLRQLWFRGAGSGSGPDTPEQASFEFPIPVFLHLAGVRSESGRRQNNQPDPAASNRREQLRIDGMAVVFERRVALLPAEYEVHQ